MAGSSWMAAIAGCGGRGVVVRSELNYHGRAREQRAACGKEREQKTASTQGVLELGTAMMKGENECTRLRVYRVGPNVVVVSPRLVTLSIPRVLLVAMHALTCLESEYDSLLTLASIHEPCHHLSLKPHAAAALLQTTRPNRMPKARPLRHPLLHTRPSAPDLAFFSSTLLLSCARAMSTKPSLAAAEDFLSFVNASPTRMSAL